ncbi:hypothetical protein RYZ26_14780 [Terasakiella sp. A23]|uniref:hypothetical protein n=1 Tax=Terasakiella sp. FCG-A23 TaxID=3080561 RepID=UPI0029554D15|nr:hypothetical protein [Terasakiella sp. A23]MDV7340869.1 hypothetical protein [Terasakiella sp. A23]
MAGSDKTPRILRNLHWIIAGVFVVAMSVSPKLFAVAERMWFETVSLITKLPDLLIWVWLPYIF